MIKKAQAETARDTMLSGLSGDDKEKATLLADALITGADITEVTLTQDAASAVIACNAVYEEMGVDQSLGFCQASLASGRRRLLADYSVSILLKTAKSDQSIIDAAVAKLSGATVSKVEGSLAVATLLSAIPGVDGDVKGHFRKGLSLHALGRYGEAVCSLEIAERLDPRNKQVVEALKMAAFKARQQPRD